MKRLFIFAVIVLMSSGCLKENPKSSTTMENYYHSEMEIVTGINGCYNPLRNIYGSRSMWETTELCADLMTLTAQSYYDANCNISPARPGIGKIVWQYGYMGVQRTNDMLYAIDRAVEGGYITQAVADPLYAETVVLRSLFYYVLTCTMGDVPFYTEPVTEQNRQEIATLPRMSATDTRSFCIGELKEWLLEKKALPMVRSYEADTDFRVGAAVGLMVGAKMCLWNEDWQGAIDFIDCLESIYGNYSSNPEQFGIDYPLTDIPFSKKFTKESIFELANVMESYGLQTSSLLASIAMPARSSLPDGDTVQADDEEESEDPDPVGLDYYSGIAIPELGGNSRISICVRPTPYYYKTVLPYAGEDLRTCEYHNGDDPSKTMVSSGNLAWCWSGYDLLTDPERTDRQVMFFWTSKSSQTKMTSSSQPWLGNKFWAYNMYDTKDPNNYKLFRFADALLMKSEAYIQNNQPEKAAQYLHITRTRAGYTQKITFEAVGSDKEAFMEEIRKERAKELFGEFQRKFDLVRWGIWYERTLQYNENKYLQDYIQPYHRYAPIPADQVMYSGYALDNKEYLE